MKKLMAALLGAVLVGWASWGAEPVRVGVFTGAGACSVGMLRWIQIACRSPELTPTYIDGAAVRAGALDKLDLVIMPGGWAGREYDDLGQDGVAKLKKFIHDGGSYIGTCAGCFLVMDDSTKQHPRLELMPYVNQQGPYLFGTILSAEFSSRAKELLGVRPGEHRVRYHGGPLMIPSKKAIPEASFEIVGTYKGDINPGTNTRTKTMTGTGCAAVGTYGKGRVVAYAIHPEYFPNSMDLVKGAFKYTTGRDITIRMPQRKPGQLVVGLLGDWAIGVESANACRDLFVRDDFDVVPLMEEICAEGMMRHLDVLVIPNMEKSPNSLRQNIYSAKARRRYEEFLARGGKIVSWGDAAKIFPCDRRNFFAIKSTELVAKLNALKNDSFAAPEAPVLKPVRAAVYADKGVSCAEYWNVSKLMACSPLYRVTFVNAADIANGVLKDFDLLLMGGDGVVIAGDKCCRVEGKTVICPDEDNSFWMHYFDLETDYGYFIDRIDEEDSYLTAAADFGKGIRILNQDPWEMLITFIISQRKSIPAIKSSVEALCRKWGKAMTDREVNINYFSFPTPNQLAKASLEELRSCGLGYRDEYIYLAAQTVMQDPDLLRELAFKSYDEIMAELLKFRGVGAKVANCVALFGYHKIEAFPIDVWIQRVLDMYYQSGFPFERYKGFAGVMQQYIFYFVRKSS